MKKGFTLIEVMVVAVIVAVLAAVAIPAYNGYITDAKTSVAENTASTIAASAAAYMAQLGTTKLSFASATTGGTVSVGGGNKVKLPADFKMAAVGTAAASVIVTHKDGSITGKVAFR